MRLACLVLACLLLSFRTEVRAAEASYPSRPVTIVVPFTAGGSTDIIARILADRFETSLGQPVRVENISGAGGVLGVEKVVRAAPDGYTLLVGNWSSHVGAPAVYPVTFDIHRDLQPVARLVDVPLMLIGRKGLPVQGLDQLVEWLRRNQDKATLATIGIGSASQLCAIDLRNQTGAQVQLVPYRGGTPAIADIVTGQVDVMCGEASGMLPHVRAGSVTAFAIVKGSRWFAAPEVPTTAELGLPALEITFWHGLWVPAQTPDAIVARLAAAVRDALSDPRVQDRIRAAGQELPPLDMQTPAGLAAHHRQSTERWWPVIRAARIKAE